MNPCLTWTPRISLISSPGEEKQIQSSIPIIITSSGCVRWAIKTRLTSLCDMTVDLFPFDRHQCTLSFGSWSDDIYLRIRKTNIQEDGHNPSWIMKSVHLDGHWNDMRNSSRNETDDRHIDIVIDVERGPSLYHRFIKFILIVIVVLILTVFWLNPKWIYIRLSFSLLVITISFLTLLHSNQFIGFSDNSILQSFLCWIVLTCLVNIFISFIVYCIGNRVYKSPLPMRLASAVNGPLGKILLLEQTGIMYDLRSQSEKRVEGSGSLCVILQEEWLLFAVLLDRFFFIIHLALFCAIFPVF